MAEDVTVHEAKLRKAIQEDIECALEEKSDSF